MDHESWLRALFSRDAPDWFMAPEAELPPLPPAETAAHVLRLLEAPGALTARWRDDQIAGGLKYLFDYGTGFAEVREMADPAVDPAGRMALAERIDRLWTEIFAPRCAPALGHLSETSEPLDMHCYMFWDGFYGLDVADPAERAALTAAFVEAMGRILALPHPACQESALHGLGHWGEQAPGRAAELIDAFLAEDRAARPELVAYARAARAGCVL